MKKYHYLWGSLILSLLTLIGCGDQKVNDVWSETEAYDAGGKLKVAATTSMVQDLVRVVGGDEVEVYGLMGEGIDPHSYVGRPTDMMALKSADLIFYSGLHLEEKLQENLEKLEYAHAVTSQLDKAELIIPEEEYSAYADPHVWGDPTLWAKTISVVVSRMAEKDPANKEEYEARGKVYQKDLLALDLWVRKRLSEIPAEQRILVTSHDAFMYYARAFGFEVRAIDGLAPGDKGGPKKVSDLVEFIKEKQLKMIFPESAANSKGIAAIAKDAGVVVSEHELFADATGKLGEMETVNGETYDVGTYIGMIKHNVNAMVEGLK
ncbi:MAG: metal ABC transporter solute-binding protein, Zn/Mn family [Akkermansiaceae bacterium]